MKNINDNLKRAKALMAAALMVLGVGASTISLTGCDSHKPIDYIIGFEVDDIDGKIEQLKAYYNAGKLSYLTQEELDIAIDMISICGNGGLLSNGEKFNFGSSELSSEYERVALKILKKPIADAINLSWHFGIGPDDITIERNGKLHFTVDGKEVHFCDAESSLLYAITDLQEFSSYGEISDIKFDREFYAEFTNLLATYMASVALEIPIYDCGVNGVKPNHDAYKKASGYQGKQI